MASNGMINHLESLRDEKPGELLTSARAVRMTYYLRAKGSITASSTISPDTRSDSLVGGSFAELERHEGSLLFKQMDLGAPCPRFF